MLVCICNALKDSQVREAARGGARSPKSAYRRLGCAFRCGQCAPFAKEVIERERAIAC